MRTQIQGLRGLRLALVALALLASAAPAGAGEKPECLSSRLANELLECAHCQAMKSLLGNRAIGKVTMEVHELDGGAIVEIEATNAAAVKLVHQLVDEIWKADSHCETTLSSVCLERYHHLGKCAVERAKSTHGALVVLRGNSPEDVAWLREDARNTRSYLLAAASR